MRGALGPRKHPWELFTVASGPPSTPGHSGMFSSDLGLVSWAKYLHFLSSSYITLLLQADWVSGSGTSKAELFRELLGQTEVPWHSLCISCFSTHSDFSPLHVSSPRPWSLYSQNQKPSVMKLRPYSWPKLSSTSSAFSPPALLPRIQQEIPAKAPPPTHGLSCLLSSQPLQSGHGHPHYTDKIRVQGGGRGSSHGPPSK